MIKKSLGDRMKQYEEVTRVHLMRRTPVIIRIDGRSFHTFTKGFTKPFDEILIKTMQQTMLALCEGIEGCVMGYTQSDEISLVLCDYRKLDTEPWFGNVLMKVCSVSASIATSAFNQHFRSVASSLDGVYQHRIGKATFDSRAFNVPLEEVCNYFIWRQQDAIRNSIEATAQAHFSHKRLLGVSCDEALEMLRTERSVDWETFPLFQQRGSCCIKQPVLVNEGTKDEIVRNKWTLDTKIPLFTEQRDYVENRIYFQGV